MRPLVSYDDIALPAPRQEAAPPAHTGGSGHGSPPKKRRKNNRQGQRQRNANQYHNGDYEEEYQDPKPKKARRDYGLKEESRPLTHDDVWDDSALIHAWDAAVEEYEVLNGPDKKWKSEPVNKSALWFNIPPEKEKPSESASPGPTFLMPSIPAAFQDQDAYQEEEPAGPSDPENSRPVNFDTFVPRHDPSLSHVKASGGETGPRSSVVPPAPQGVAGQVTKDQAFEHAMGAWYWAGYWTGVYHNASGAVAPAVTHANKEGEDEDEMNGVEQEAALEDSQGEDARVEDEDLLPT